MKAKLPNRPHDRGGALYELYADVECELTRFASAHGWQHILPAPVAPRLEFPESRSLIVASGGRSELILPASNTFQKQVAAAHLGPVYCIAASYRRDNVAVERRDALHLPVFHQIEVELPGARMDDARDAARDLLSRLQVVATRSGSDWSFDDCDEIDLRNLDRPRTQGAYDVWATKLADEVTRPTWVLHTPQTVPPCLNESIDSGLSRGFDLVVPEVGELLSGGRRDLEQTRDFFAPDAVRLPTDGSSGFGIGLERLLMLLRGEGSVQEALLPHARVWTSMVKSSASMPH